MHQLLIPPANAFALFQQLRKLNAPTITKFLGFAADPSSVSTSTVQSTARTLRSGSITALFSQLENRLYNQVIWEIDTIIKYSTEDEVDVKKADQILLGRTADCPNFDCSIERFGELYREKGPKADLPGAHETLTGL